MKSAGSSCRNKDSGSSSVDTNTSGTLYWTKVLASPIRTKVSNTFIIEYFERLSYLFPILHPFNTQNELGLSVITSQIKPQRTLVSCKQISLLVLKLTSYKRIDSFRKIQTSRKETQETARAGPQEKERPVPENTSDLQIDSCCDGRRFSPYAVASLRRLVTLENPSILHEVPCFQALMIAFWGKPWDRYWSEQQEICVKPSESLVSTRKIMQPKDLTSHKARGSSV